MRHSAVYGGTFDPPTNGHLDIVRRIAPLFDTLHLVVAHNPRKTPLFTAEERAALLRDCLPDLHNIDVHVHSGLLVDFCKAQGSRVLIRGLRKMSDFESELQMASMNRRLAPGIETLQVMTDEKYFFVSSSLIKEVAYHQGDLGELVPAPVAKLLKERFSK